VAFKERRFNDITMFQAKSQDVSAEFQTVPSWNALNSFASAGHAV
jgi:hypothetical protein